MKIKIINIILIVLLTIGLSFSIQKCSHYKNEYIDNIRIMNDTIEYYTTKTNNLVATKTIYETDIKHLKYLNDSLYKAIKNIKPKTKVVTATQFSGYIDNSTHDTTYIVKHDTITKGFKHSFNFDNEYRLLSGDISYTNDSLNMIIDKDIIQFDYTIALDKKNRIYITSNNPYVKYNSISGFTIPKKRNKRWSVGPSIGYSYDIRKNTFSPTVGISLQYGLIQW